MAGTLPRCALATLAVVCLGAGHLIKLGNVVVRASKPADIARVSTLLGLGQQSVRLAPAALAAAPKAVHGSPCTTAGGVCPSLTSTIDEAATLAAVPRPKLVFVVSRIGGEDGVSLEIMHWVRILQRQGFETHIITGQRTASAELLELERGTRGVKIKVIPEANPDPTLEVNQREFDLLFKERDVEAGLAALDARASIIQNEMETYLRGLVGPVVVDLENLGLPWYQSSLAAASVGMVNNLKPPVLARIHDLPDDRPVYDWANIDERIKRRISITENPTTVFATINSFDLARLQARGITAARIVPNTVDMTDPRLAVRPSDAELGELRRTILGDAHANDFVALAPVRPVGRKRLDVAIRLLQKLRTNHPDLPVSLVVTHGIQDASKAELAALRAAAAEADVNLVFAAEVTDADPLVLHHLSDATIYPSDFEGYGNALLEAMLARAPIFMNEYSVFQADIAKTGVDAVTFEIPESFTFTDFQAEGLAVFERSDVLALDAQLDARSHSLADALRSRGRPGGPLAGRWLQMADTNTAVLKANNDYPQVSRIMHQLIWDALSAARTQ